MYWKKILVGIGLTTILFWELFFKGYVAAPVDTLVGAYYPWLSYKWGYVVGVPVKNGMLSDVFSQFFIWKHVGSEILFSGHIPTWNPFALLGTPFLATFHSALLFPGNILFLLPKFWGWNLFIVGSTVTAALSMYLYLSQVLKNKSTAIIGAVIFSLGGPMTTWSELGTAVWAMALIPLIFWLIEKNKLRFIPAIFFCLIMAGNVQICTYAAILIPLYALVKKNFSILINVCLFLCLGVMLAAIQLLPTAQLYKDSIRAEEKYTLQFNYGLSEPDQLVRFIAPDIFGHPTTGNYTNKYSYHEYTGFFSSAGLVIAVSTSIFLLFNKLRRNKTDIFFTITFLLSIFLSVDTPISHYIFSLPIPLLTYSSASRVFFMTVMAGGYLVARGIELVASIRKIIFIISILALCVCVKFIVSHTQLNIAVKNSIIPVAAIISINIILFLPKRIQVILFLLLTCFDLGRFYRKYNPFVPNRLAFPKTQAIEFLQNHPKYSFVSLSDNVIPANTWMYYGVRSFEGYDPLHLQSFNRFSQVANSQHYQNSPSRYVDITSPNIPLLRRANVGYYVIRKDQPENFGIRKMDKVFDAEQVEIYFDRKAQPYKYVLTSHITYTTDEQLGRLLEDSNLDPNTAIINRSVTKLGIVAQNYDLGWKASSNGKYLKTLPVDGALLGVELPADISIDTVKFNYAPDSLLLGAALSAIGLIVYLFLSRLKT